ncbi:MAG: hypothetical protein IPK97_13390 [Ahniella sp.]|nr:hypothetical protein [Ahniella sp.]
MRMSIAMRADLLKTLLVEDRQEIRGIRSSIYNLTTLLATASFAISAFLFRQDQTFAASSFTRTIIDGLFVMLLWVLFLRLKRDLHRARQCLVARQKLIMGLGTASGMAIFNPFQDARKQTTDVSDSELWWLPILATLAIMIKALVVYNQHP